MFLIKLYLATMNKHFWIAINFENICDEAEFGMKYAWDTDVLVLPSFMTGLKHLEVEW